MTHPAVPGRAEGFAEVPTIGGTPNDRGSCSLISFGVQHEKSPSGPDVLRAQYPNRPHVRVKPNEQTTHQVYATRQVGFGRKNAKTFARRAFPAPVRWVEQ